MAEPSLEMLQTLILRSLEEHAATRRELADIRGLSLALNDKVQRLDEKVQRVDRSIFEAKQDIHEVKDDIWIMLKAGLMGRRGHYETRPGGRIDAPEDRMAAIEAPKA